MKVEGCSNPGLSFTQKYKKAIINIYDFLHDDCTPGKYDYSVFQNLISSSISSDNSEIRMIMSIPWWRSHPIHENRATESIWTEPCNPLLRATKSTKRATSA